MLRVQATSLLTALSALPCVWVIAGCAFNPPEPGGTPGGPEPRTSLIFCDIERTRECAAPQDLAMGIDLAKPNEEGFWVDRSSAYGLDYSPAATAQCGGMPQKVFFYGPFPDGSDYCVNPDYIGAGKTVATVTDACIDVCRYRDLSGDCVSNARASHGAETPFPNACTESGMLRPNFQDQRRLSAMTPVVWTSTVGVDVNVNSLRKTSATPAYDAGGASSSILPNGANGAFAFTATETDKERAAGFAEGPPPDNDPSDADIRYRVVLQKGGVLQVVDDGLLTFTGSYAAGDTIRLVAVARTVYYFRNSTLLATSGVPVSNVLRVSVSLLDMNATITGAATTF